MMNQRKSTPSLMEDLLSGRRRRQEGQSGGQPDVEPIRDEVGSGEEKKKATFYILEDVLHNLDEMQLQLRRLADSSQRGQISKSAIVEAALQIAMEELAQHPEESALAQRLIQP